RLVTSGRWCSSEGREGMGLAEVLLLLFLTLGPMGSIGAENTSTDITFPLPSNCPKSCGNISFEYPFGISSGCFRAGFNLTCINQTTDPPSQSLLLGDGTIEVIDFDMDNGTVYVKTPIVTMDVDEEYLSDTLIDLRNFPFSFNLDANFTDSFTISLAYNWFFVSGCSANADLAFLYNGRNFIRENIEGIVNGTRTQVSVTTLAYYITDHPTCKEAYKNMITYACRSKNSDCYDVFPRKLEVKINNDRFYFSFAYENQPFIGLEELLILNWIITDQSCKDAKLNTTTFACVDQHSSCNDKKISSNDGQEISGYRCQCNDGYEGNPYLLNGCRGTWNFFPPSLI
ncbi:unnamed protein product, partial [Musa hybrid cultivar]